MNSSQPPLDRQSYGRMKINILNSVAPHEGTAMTQFPYEVSAFPCLSLHESDWKSKSVLKPWRQVRPDASQK